MTDTMYITRDNNSANNINQCHVRIVKATISSSVRINDENEMETIWI